MSVIGILDYDFLTYQPLLPNLECAKICSYYKQNHDIAVLASNMEPARYTKFFVRKDYDDGNYPKELFEDNVTYGGRAFNKDKYKPLPLDIEECAPDMLAYLKFSNLYDRTRELKMLFTKLIRGEHLRLSLDGSTIWDKYDKNLVLTQNTDSIFLHDYDLAKINGSFDIIKNMSLRYTVKGNKERLRRIGMKFPVIINSSDELSKWSTLAPSFHVFFLQYNGLMDNEALYDLCNNNKMVAKQLYYNIGLAQYSEDYFLENILPKFYKQVLFLRSNNIKILLKYEDKFNVSQRLKNLIELFNAYLSRAIFDYGLNYRQNLYYFCSHKGYNKFRKMNKYIYPLEDARDCFAYVREKNYEVFKMFYEWDIVKFKGGEFIKNDE